MALNKVGRLGYGGTGVADQLDKILDQLTGFTISGPLAGAGAGVEIALPIVDTQDTLLKVLTHAGGTFTDVTANTTIADLRPSVQFTLSGVVSGDKVTVDGKTYTFTNASVTPSSGGYAPYTVKVGSTDAISATNLGNAIVAGSNGAFQFITAGAVLTVYYNTEGTSGNGKTVSVAQSNGHITDSAGTFTGGSATNGIKVSSDTTGAQVLVFWYKTSRILGQE